MLEKVRIQDFKGIRDLTVSLEPFTVFVGANGSGKTSILQAIYCANYEPKNSNAPEGFLQGPYWIRGGCQQGFPRELRIEFASKDWNIPPCLAQYAPPNSSDGDLADFQKLTNNPKPPTVRQLGRAKATQTNDVLDARPVPTTQFLEFDARQLGYPWTVEPGNPPLHPTGRNLASVLALTQLSQPDEFEQINECLRAVIPSVRRIRFQRVQHFRAFQQGNRHGTAEEILIDTTTVTGMPARFASQGTLLALAMLTALLRNIGPQIILLDGLELSLHPTAQRAAITQIRRVVEVLSPNVQVVATTHSPDLLDVLFPEEVRLVALSERGDVECRRLQDHPDFERWKEEMQPGELWSIFGEEWVTRHSVRGETPE